MFTITIKTNRIYFESFEAPCGEPEETEIRQAWEQAACAAIEDAGYESRIDIGVGHDPAIRWYLGYNDRRGFDWSGPADLRPADAEIGFQPEYDCEECENAEAAELWHSVIPIIRRDAQRVAEDAISAASRAAQALSDQFVARSEATEDEED